MPDKLHNRNSRVTQQPPAIALRSTGLQPCWDWWNTATAIPKGRRSRRRAAARSPLPAAAAARRRRLSSSGSGSRPFCHQLPSPPPACRVQQSCSAAAAHRLGCRHLTLASHQQRRGGRQAGQDGQQGQGVASALTPTPVARCPTPCRLTASFSAGGRIWVGGRVILGAEGSGSRDAIGGLVRCDADVSCPLIHSSAHLVVLCLLPPAAAAGRSMWAAPGQQQGRAACCCRHSSGKCLGG